MSRPLPGRPADPSPSLLGQLCREFECVRAAYLSAGPLRRWWLRRRLQRLERERAAMEWAWMHRERP